MTKKLIVGFLVIFYCLGSQKSVNSQCSSGSCGVSSYYGQNYSYPGYSSSYSYPVYYSNPIIYSRPMYTSNAISYKTEPQCIQISNQSVISKAQSPLVPVIRKKQSPPYTTPTLEAPSQIKVGELAVLRVKNSTTKVAWIVVPQKINFQEFENGASACFSSPIAANYSFFAAVGSGNDLIVLPHNLVVIDDRPTPPIPPGPNPPTPTDTKQAVKAAIAKVSSQKKVSEAQFLAFSFLSIANLIKTGAVTNSQVIIDLTTASNRQALGQEKDKWLPFFTDLSLLLNNMSKNGQLATPEQHIQTWTIIADALRETI